MSTSPSSPRWSLFELSATYYQDSDCNDIDDPGQELKVSAESNGSGTFLALSTRRWAVGGPTELQALLADFIGRGAGLLHLEQVAPAAAEPTVTAPAVSVSADMVEPIAMRRDYSQGLPEACGHTYLCDACGHDGGLGFDDCTQPGCKGMYLASRPPMGPYLAHEYGFGQPAGPYPVEAVDISQERIPETTTNGQCPYCQSWGPWGVACNLDEGKPGATFGGVVPAPAPEVSAATESLPAAGQESKRLGAAARRWSPEQDEQLLREYDTRPKAELATEFGRSAHALVQRHGYLKSLPAKPETGTRPAVRVEEQQPTPAPKPKAEKIDPALRTQVRQKAKAIVKKKEEQAKKKPEPVVTAAFIRTLAPNDPARLAYQRDGIRGYEAYQQQKGAARG